jgi:hypothetical protein
MKKQPGTSENSFNSNQWRKLKMFVKYFLIPLIVVAVTMFWGGYKWREVREQEEKNRKVIKRIPSKQ